MASGIVAAIAAAVSAATSGGIAYEQSRKANSQAEAYQEEVQRQEAQQRRIARRQVTGEANERRRQRLAEAARIESQAQAAAAESGVGVGGTFESMMQQIQTDADRNTGNIMSSLQNELAGISLNRTVFQSHERTPWLEGLSAGVRSGTQTYSALSGGR